MAASDLYVIYFLYGAALYSYRGSDFIEQCYIQKIDEDQEFFNITTLH